MLDDLVALQALCRSFAGGLGGIDRAIGLRDVSETETDLAARVGALAAALGWRTGLRFRLLPLDYQRVGPFPQRLHQHTAAVRLNGARDAELIMNLNALDMGNFSILLERLPVFLWLFGRLLERTPGLVADVPCFPGDACFWPAVASSANCPDACLVPDPDYFRTAGYADFRTAMESLPAWETRRSAVLWRGSTSGIKRYWPPAGKHDVQWLARLELCERARSGAAAALCDIGHTGLVQIPDDGRRMLAGRLAALRRPPLDKASFAHYKAVVDVDGNSNTWSSGLYCSLLTGACVLKISSEHGFSQWYYDRLEPWIHFVPVRSDLSDFDDKVRLVMADDDLAHTVGNRGRTFARSMDFMAELEATVDRMISWTASNASTAGSRAVRHRDPA